MMRVLIVVAPYRECPPKAYAGVERVCWWYVREMVRQGHDVTTICVPGSTVPGRRVIWDGGEGLPEQAHIREPVFGVWWDVEFPKLNAEHMFDVVNDHTHLKLPSVYCERHGIPYVNTVHLPGPPFTKNAMALSEGHKAQVSPTAVVVHLGVPLEDYPFNDNKGDYALYLGCMARHKGIHLAMDAAKELGISLVLAGPEEFDVPYFNEMIMPRLDENITWVGEVGGETKLSLLNRARFIVCPIQWEEPGSTVAFEALACGTPVVAFARGAFKDIITDERIGTLVTTYEGLVEAMRKPPTDYEACREHAAKFDIPSRVEKYLELYERVIAGEKW